MIDKIKLIAAAAVIVAGVGLFYGLAEQSMLIRVGIVIASVVAAAALALASAPGQEAWAFILDARTEVRKVVWPTRRETIQGTLVVIVMVIIIGLYLWLLDQFSFWVIYDMVLGTST